MVFWSAKSSPLLADSKTVNYLSIQPVLKSLAIEKAVRVCRYKHQRVGVVKENKVIDVTAVTKLFQEKLTHGTAWFEGRQGRL